MQIRSFPGSGEPVWVNAYANACLRLGPDPRRALDSEISRPSIDPELMIRMLIIGYCYGIRFERRLCEEVELHLAYRWFCRLDLDDKVPDHSTFSVNRHGRRALNRHRGSVLHAAGMHCTVEAFTPN